MSTFPETTYMLDPQISERINASFGRQKLMQFYGATIEGIDNGFMAIAVPPTDFLLRTSGIFHGGVIAALADTAGGYAATTLYPQDVSFLTIEFKINFLRQAKGEKLIAKATVIKGGATITVVQTDLFILNNDKEAQVATSLITLIKASK
ncbi:PaaI family thioesterase [Chitinophaga sp. 22321]|uniref:Medium/long-chain acyl-CoA thioesterase YigI n=1 Tax=Chitinophaga hostae TaxID=2831022 RepID=A0ABS5J2G6_9BACT|nr:PaaI family thioesterase [Chitinophaga hostae]MBS0029248.1 PaaI family thioesterase [Chitinophaga hostae]